MLKVEDCQTTKAKEVKDKSIKHKKPGKDQLQEQMDGIILKIINSKIVIPNKEIIASIENKKSN